MSSEQTAPLEENSDSPPSSFEEALKKLESIVDRLENEAPPLEEALAAYEEGTMLAKQCLERLERAELRIRSLKLDD